MDEYGFEQGEPYGPRMWLGRGSEVILDVVQTVWQKLRELRFPAGSLMSPKTFFVLRRSKLEPSCDMKCGQFGESWRIGQKFGLFWRSFGEISADFWRTFGEFWLILGVLQPGNRMILAKDFLGSPQAKIAKCASFPCYKRVNKRSLLNEVLVETCILNGGQFGAKFAGWFLLGGSEQKTSAKT